jgi:hypothetical protein
MITTALTLIRSCEQVNVLVTPSLPSNDLVVSHRLYRDIFEADASIDSLLPQLHQRIQQLNIAAGGGV